MAGRRRRCGSRATGCWIVATPAELARFLDEPREAFGTRVKIAERDGDGRVIGSRDAHVWHCSLSLHPDEPELSDERWRRSARGSSRRWVSPAPTRERSAGGWRSATASPPAALTMLTSSSALVAEDGSKASVHNDRPRAQQRRARARGAVRSAPAGGADARYRQSRRSGRVSGWPTRAASATTVPRAARPERGSRQTLERIVRGCATASRNESEFVRALREHGVRVRPRYAEGGRTKVVGYSVRLPGPDSGSRPGGVVRRRAPGARSDPSLAARGLATGRQRAGRRGQGVELVDGHARTLRE